LPDVPTASRSQRLLLLVLPVHVATNSVLSVRFAMGDFSYSYLVIAP
jgi:hypothetical protein